ncbi:DNA-methyltransferase (dcm) [Orenia metallireducens]|uniref:Cytosine-specific methyltransferase n=1 Tax=Orenia metallireducens TaxID=1413210 RepID=A0A285GU86_9FIRM|nr:DNA cytosine methyltransferase [Orenia metallireducens]SNY26814.1 DNA-methyltransferase (dcm) [Orenia metallireducens]
MKKYRTIDLFCGAGGFSKGFEMSGRFEIVKGYDNNEEALKTYNNNHQGEGLNYDVTQEVPEELKDGSIEVVIGSPPCQGFSDAIGNRKLDDERNGLVFHFIRWVSEIQPKVVVMENVEGMLTIDKHFITEVEKEYDKAGYKLNYDTVNSMDFGVPQKRNRAIFIATQKGMPYPTLPDSIVGKQLNLFTKDKLFDSYITVGQAISDLPSPYIYDDEKDKNNDKVSLPYKCVYQNEYQNIMRKNSNEVYNHIAKIPKKKDLFIVENIPEGKMYRSTRFGKKYIGVWDLFKDEFTYEQRIILWFIARHRGRKAYKLEDKSGPDYIPENKIIDSLKREEVVKEAIEYGFESLIENKVNIAIDDIRSLKENGWLRTKEKADIIAYDLNTKSGVRPRYMRLNTKEQSNTILTADFDAREKLHPFENRGLSLREGARIQSFPDDFIFEGDFDAIARQIGNAVPPLMSRAIAEHILTFLEDKKEKAV